MAGYGLKEAWIESGIIGPGAADAVLEGKKYKRVMRVHKMTVQALWHMILLALVKFCEESNSNFHAQLMHHLTDCYNFRDFRDGNATMNDFITQRGEENANFSYWWSYVEMVETLLQFTRAERDGILYLHVHSFFKLYSLILWGTITIAMENEVQYIWQTWCSFQSQCLMSFNRAIMLLKDHRVRSGRRWPWTRMVD